jgi:hypothetical protein
MVWEEVKSVSDSENREKRQAELLSAAIDSLNQGLPPDDDWEEEELADLLATARLIKEVAPIEPPSAVLQHIVDEAAGAIAREKRKKRLNRILASCTGVAAAAAVIAFLYIAPPTTQEPQMAKQPQAVPAPSAAPPQPAAIATPPRPAEPSPAIEEQPVPSADTKVVAQAETLPGELPPSVALGLTTPTTPAKSETMLALADRKADSVTIDSISNTIRQIYRKGAPDEIILTQAPKRAEVFQSVVPAPPSAKMKAANVNEAVERKIKAPDRNKVTVIVDDKEVTLEGALSREELLKLADTLTNVNVAQQ